MSVRPTDGGGLLGTPLPPLPRGPVSLRTSSPADRIAPSPELYDILNMRRHSQTNHNTSSAAPLLHPSHPSLLYASSQGPKSRATSVDQIMDPQDRVQRRLTTRRRGRGALDAAHADNNVFLPVPFEVAAAEEPELVPRRVEQSVGHVMLREGRRRDRESARGSRFGTLDMSGDSRYGLTQFMAFASRGKTGVKGLGFEEKGSGGEGGGRLRLVKRGEGVGVMEEDRRGRFGGMGEDDDDDDYANGAYRDLHSATERVQLKLLKQRRRASERAKELRKRALHIAGLEQGDSVLFEGFEQTETLFQPSDICLSQDVPKEFQSMPVHDFERDRYRAQRDVLPQRLRQECEMLADRQRQLFQRKERVVKAAIAKSEEKREERLRKMRERFAVDMRANFVAPSLGASELQTAGTLLANKSNLSAASQKVVKVGDSNRTIEEWHPPPSLCELFGVQVPKNTTAAIESSEVKGRPLDEYSDSDDESDFQIHAIIGADGHRINFQSSKLTLVSDKDVILTPAEAPRTLGEKEIDVINPSKELYSAIFKKTGCAADKGDISANHGTSP